MNSKPQNIGSEKANVPISKHGLLEQLRKESHGSKENGEAKEAKETSPASLFSTSHPNSVQASLTRVPSAVHCWQTAIVFSKAPAGSEGFGGLLFPLIDASLATQNMVTAAEMMGLGSVIIGTPTQHPAEVAALLELPERVYPLMLVTIFPDFGFKYLTCKPYEKEIINKEIKKARAMGETVKI